MTNQEFDQIIGSIEANFENFIAKDKHKRDAWFDAIAYFPFNRCLTTIDALCEIAQDYKTVKAVSIAAFKKAYYKKFPKEEKQLVSLMNKDLDCCDHGIRYLIMGGRYPFTKPICLKKNATRFDEAGTVYKSYNLHNVPCSCVNGQNVSSSHRNFDYDMQQLAKFAENSFGKRVLAYEYYANNIEPISGVKLP